MSAVIMDGKTLAAKIRGEMKVRCEALKAAGKETSLAVVLVGEDPASQIYVRNKVKACEEIGIRSIALRLPADISQQELEDKVCALNADPTVDGILVQLPLPKGLKEKPVLDKIAPEKDVDGFHPTNTGLLSQARPQVISGTPRGCMRILKEYNVETDGRLAVVIGRSNIVGRPMAMLLEQANATVIVCHSHTKDLAKWTREADIVVAACGVPKLIRGDMLKPGAAVIDVGMDRDENGKLCGDVDFETAKEVAGWITPVPGGVGPMTIAMLMTAVMDASEAKAR